MRDVWLLYTGVTLAPWSENIYAPGWRFRAQSGYGEYTYQLDDGGSLSAHKGSISYADALIGYHWQEGAFTAKIFAGLSVIDHIALPSASKGRLVGLKWGPKAATELWLDIGETQWTSLNLSFTTAHSTVSARWRYGFDIMDGLSFGPELRLDTNAGLYEGYSDLFREYEGRAGVFAAYTWDGYELTLAGGFAAYVKGFEAAEQITPYATVNFLMQF